MSYEYQEVQDNIRYTGDNLDEILQVAKECDAWIMKTTVTEGVNPPTITYHINGELLDLNTSLIIDDGFCRVIKDE